MSETKNLHEANRWWQTARDDLLAAQALVKAEMFAHACFECQQSGEKAVKALWLSIDEDPWGHSIQKLVSEFPRPDWLKPHDQWLANAAFLDKYYIPTRYPNSLPDLTPAQSYGAEDARMALERASFLLKQVRLLLPEK
ncbi:MAG: HEPN domain-containing protein [Anaerolineales bacterium]|nr:HEPN domain-containing protein [Anaerolineales bacterium]